MFRLLGQTGAVSGVRLSRVRVGLLVVPLMVHLAPGVDPVDLGGRRARDLLFVVSSKGWSHEYRDLDPGGDLIKGRLVSYMGLHEILYKFFAVSLIIGFQDVYATS